MLGWFSDKYRTCYSCGTVFSKASAADTRPGNATANNVTDTMSSVLMFFNLSVNER